MPFLHGTVIRSVSSVMKGLVFMPMLRGTVETVDCFLGPYCMEIPRYSLMFTGNFESSIMFIHWID